MKNLKRLLASTLVVLSAVSASADCWVDTYWPLGPGNYWSFTHEVTVGNDEIGGGQFQVWQQMPYSYDYEVHDQVDGKVYLELVDSGYLRVFFDPTVLLFDDELLRKGGSRTTRTTVSQRGADYRATFTVTVRLAGTVTVPAGTYANCRSVTVQEVAYPPGQPAVSATVMTAVLAPQVGLIKKRASINDKLVWVELVSGTVGGMNVTDLAGAGGGTPPSITTAPRSTTVTNNDPVTLTVTASGQSLTYEWLKDGSPLSDDSRVTGSETATLRITPAQPEDAGAYSVRVSNTACSVVSAEATLTVVEVDSLVLRTNGLGTIVPGFKGTLLALGNAYTVTAIPAAGQVFSNWTDGGGSPLTNHPVLRFLMEPGLVLAANFVPDPFPAVAGNYNGLFHEAGVARHETSGAFKAKVQPGGAFSATLQTGARKYPFSGRFGLDGRSTNTVSRRGTNALTVEMEVDLAGGRQISGRVKGDDWTSGLLADLATFNATSNPATNYAGQYTLVIPGGTNSSVVEPAGDGFAAGKISPAGMMAFKITLADGTAAVAGLAVSAEGAVPFYVPLYGGGGSALGWLRVKPAEEVDLEGDLAWFKPALARSSYYPNGFALKSPVEGSLYTPFGTNRVLNTGAATVALAEGGLPAPFAVEVTLGSSGRVIGTGTNRLTFKAVSATGLFGGSVVPPGGTKPIPFKGALLQRQGVGRGFFLNGNQSGRLQLAP